jgi:hypothetical protein
MRITRWGLMILLVSPVGIAVAQPQQDQTPPQPAQQQQQDPVAAAARRAHDQKKDQAKAAKVYDNDSLPSVPGAINVVGQPAAADQGTPSVPSQPSNAGAASAADNPAVSRDLSSAKAQLLSLQKDLDILQRTFTLDEQMYLLKPEHGGDTAEAAKLKDEKSQIADKQQEIAEAQKKVDDLQAKLTANGGSPKQ